eukprot:2302614-Amphidinium_carterae.1
MQHILLCQAVPEDAGLGFTGAICCYNKWPEAEVGLGVRPERVGPARSEATPCIEGIGTQNQSTH